MKNALENSVGEMATSNWISTGFLNQFTPLSAVYETIYNTILCNNQHVYKILSI